jgi:hypothetical protein
MPKQLRVKNKGMKLTRIKKQHFMRISALRMRKVENVNLEVS